MPQITAIKVNNTTYEISDVNYKLNLVYNSLTDIQTLSFEDLKSNIFLSTDFSNNTNPGSNFVSAFHNLPEIPSKIRLTMDDIDVILQKTTSDEVYIGETYQYQVELDVEDNHMALMIIPPAPNVSSESYVNDNILYLDSFTPTSIYNYDEQYMVFGAKGSITPIIGPSI